MSTWGLTSTRYTIESDQIQHSFRIAQISDLHASLFEKNNRKLISEVVSAKPDAIFITGDLVNNKSGKDTTVATKLIHSLSSIAPVYFSYGNQEASLEEEYNVDIRALYTEAGAIVLDREYIDTEIKGQPVRIGGIYGYCQSEAYAQESHREDESEYLKDFQNTDLYTLLMCHIPVSWIGGSLYDWDVDCVFSGHVHGGQVRIPFLGGLYAPDLGWFPGQLSGVYETSEEDWIEHRTKLVKWAQDNNYDTSYYEEHQSYEPSKVILSRGLGNTDWIPRFNNEPEIVFVDFIPGA